MIPYIGIDPGIHGAAGVIDGDGLFVRVDDLPILGGLLDIEGFEGVVGRWPSPAVVVIEQPQNYNATARSSGTTWRNIGRMEAIIAAWPETFKLTWVQPSAWTQVLQVGADKSKHVARAAELFPGAVLKGPRGGLLDGRADSLLIAEWGRRKKR